MTDVLLDGHVIRVPPGWTIRITLERLADAEHPVTTKTNGDGGYSRLDRVKDPGDGGARPAGTEHEPTIDEVDPLPVMGRRGRPFKPEPPTKRGGSRPGKPCPKCHLRVGPRTAVCMCGYDFYPKAKGAS